MVKRIRLLNMKKKLIVDILLFILMILEFSRNYMPTLWHEIIGIILLILVIIHLILNINYIKSINNGKYNLRRTIMLIINILFMLFFFISMIFGILSSQEILTFLNIKNLNIIKLHKIFAYVSLLLMSLHLGINFSSMFGLIEKKINKIVLILLSLLIIGFGIYSFIDLDFWNHITGKYGFSIVTGNIIINTLEYLSIVMSISIITNIVYKKIK